MPGIPDTLGELGLVPIVKIERVAMPWNLAEPCLVVQAEADYHCPAEQSEQFYIVLKANGCTTEMVRIPGASHVGAISGPPVARRVQNEVIFDWTNRHVLGKTQVS